MAIKLLRVTEINTINPPIKAHFPGLSPRIRKTHIGFRIGSIPGINIASMAVTCLIALE
jgi:hypothetical protein